ncbi:hypothetical protein JW707_00405, partial [Candidatus Woesearchaeota archaeon]|nr:hypothetical protein [Candidatus Woesearchaeota archaeon]
AGIESADPRMRRAYGKAETNIADMLTKVELMLYHGIQLHASFILGGRGETEESMRETTELARKLVDYDNVTWVLISPQLILPGSPDYRELLKQDGMHEKYADEDLIDIVEINQDFLRQFASSLTRAQIIEEIRKTFECIRRKTEKPVLDVKGVVKEEEGYVKPSRRYSE